MELSSCVAVPHSPSSQPPISCGFCSATTRSVTYWRPWEDPYKDSLLDGDIVTSQKSLVTPKKPYFSSMSVPVSPQPQTPHGRLLRRAEKRSAGDLAKRRQRLVSFQLSHTPPSTPNKSEPELSPLSEPDQSPLESGSWGSHPGSFRLDCKESSASRRLDLSGSSSQDLSSPGIPLVQKRPLEDYSNHTNPVLVAIPRLFILSIPLPLPTPNMAAQQHEANKPGQL